MRKTPSYLKGLAETRARATGDSLRLQRILDDVTYQLHESRQLADSCDRLIKQFDKRLDPSLITPIRAWKGRYGKHGALTAAIKHYIAAAAPNEVGTFELTAFLQTHFQLDFETTAEKTNWQSNTLIARMKALCQSGFLEKLVHTYEGVSAVDVRWRWKSEIALSLDHLHQLAEEQDVSVQQTDVCHE